MKGETAKEELEKFLAARGITLSRLTPSQGMGAMLAFYAAVRVVDCDLDCDGDMLLFQWGTFDWGAGCRFEVDITRQFIAGCGEDHNIWQLQLTFAFPPSDLLRAIGKGDRWCRSPAELADLASYIEAHPALAAVGTRPDARVTLHYQCAG
jgi:hypothetical protein